uniref:Uncharacterized protein n=1 Tax=Anguilla anguilla TaxID=7936 RepID=A0A0E9RR95_ANGAN
MFIQEHGLETFTTRASYEVVISLAENSDTARWTGGQKR